ncbi:ABC transporter permease subunit, partial [Mycoplasmopsis bovis]|uniref:ABC transporter permease subunit n=1 Tax=Mycoplasmopsis bovis TaxID=28903 RepID=UPI003D2AA0FA
SETTKIGGIILLKKFAKLFTPELSFLTHAVYVVGNPNLVVSLSSMAVYTLYARNQTVTVLTSNYVLIAKTKGLSTMQIFRKYVFRNISIPLSAIILPSYIGLL